MSTAVTLDNWLKQAHYPNLPLNIAHRGACHHAPENSLAACRLASTLGADFWEIDVHLSQDGHCFVSHDDDLTQHYGVNACISTSESHQLRNWQVPTLQDMLQLARHLTTGLYIELKGKRSASVANRICQESGYDKIILASFQSDWIAELRQQNCPFPLAVLIPLGQDPWQIADQCQPDIVHLCWEKAENPARLITETLCQTAQQRDIALVAWHEERPDQIQALQGLPLWGICSDRPELLTPSLTRYAQGPKLVCHRGASQLAPENSLAAAEIAFSQGFDYVEIDLRESRDGKIFAHHDPLLDRTTNGRGDFMDYWADDIRQLDSGSWFSDIYHATPPATLSEMLALAIKWDKNFYLEIKQTQPENVLALVDQYQAFDRCFFWSFSQPICRKIKSLAPQAQMMVRHQDYQTLEQAKSDYQADIIEINYTEAYSDIIPRCHDLGCQAMIAYMGADRSIIDQLLASQADLLNIHHSQIVKQQILKKNYLDKIT